MASENELAEDTAAAETDEMAQRVLDIASDIARLKAATGLGPDALKMELTGTAMHHSLSIARMQVEMRNWMVHNVNELREHIELIYSHLPDEEEQTTQFLPEDAEKFLKLIEAVKWFAGEVAKSEQTDEGKAKLAGLAQLANDCEQIISDGLLVEVDEDDEGEEAEAPQETTN